MMRMKDLVAATILNLSLIGCSSSSVIPDIPPSKLYAIAQKQLQNGNFKLAIKQLEEFYNLYPLGSYAQQAQLDLIYAYYKSNDLPSLKATIARFIRLNPNHPNIDYVIYMNGLSEIALDNCTLQGFFHIEANPSDRDLIHVRNAYYDFAQLLREYPNSQYAADAQKRLNFLKERLAKYELLVAQFYTKIGAYVAVVNRIESMIKDYPNTPETHKALFLMENAYRQLQLTTEADKVAKIIAVN